MKVAILGCGPTGLIAAHACASRDIPFVIFSKKRKSYLFGSQYLHEPIPGIVGEHEGEHVKYVNIGTPEEYRRKTHGPYWDGMVAPEDFETDHMAWNIREAYDRLWRRYNEYIIDYEIPMRTNGLRGDPDYCIVHPAIVLYDNISLHNYNLVISTVPRKIWATRNEEFVYSEGWALGDAPEHGTFVPYEVADMTIICDGSNGVAYNRLSRVFGYATVEWPGQLSLNELRWREFDGAPTRFVKPLRCTLNKDNPVNAPHWLHVGRYGKWHKGVLTTDAWHEVNERLERHGP